MKVLVLFLVSYFFEIIEGFLFLVWVYFAILIPQESKLTSKICWNTSFCDTVKRNAKKRNYSLLRWTLKAPFLQNSKFFIRVSSDSLLREGDFPKENLSIFWCECWQAKNAKNATNNYRPVFILIVFKKYICLTFCINGSIDSSLLEEDWWIAKLTNFLFHWNPDTRKLPKSGWSIELSRHSHSYLTLLASLFLESLNQLLLLDWVCEHKIIISAFVRILQGGKC